MDIAKRKASFIPFVLSLFCQSFCSSSLCSRKLGANHRPILFGMSTFMDIQQNLVGTTAN